MKESTKYVGTPWQCIPLESYKHTETYKGLQKSTRELREGETSFFFSFAII